MLLEDRRGFRFALERHIMASCQLSESLPPSFLSEPEPMVDEQSSSSMFFGCWRWMI